MTKVKDIYEHLCSIAPLELQMGFDNSGFQLGDKDYELERVLLALDVTDAVVQEAIDKGAKLIVSHHPLIFHAIKSIDASEAAGARIIRLIQNGISVISMHTNLDIAEGGVNDVLINILGAHAEDVLDGAGCGRVGYLESPIEFQHFILRCKSVLESKGLRYYDAGRTVHKIAVMGGAGGSSLEDAYYKGCDTYISSDFSYHIFQRAEELNMNLIDADHFCTENPIIPVLCESLSNTFPDTEFLVSEEHKQIVSFI